MRYLVQNSLGVSSEAQPGEAQVDAVTAEKVAALARKRRKVKIFLMSFGAFLVLAATVLMLAGYFTPFYVDQTLKAGNYYGIVIAQDVNATGDIRLANLPNDIFTLAKFKNVLLVTAPGFAPIYTGVDLAIAGFSLFIIAIPVIIAAVFVKGQLTAMPVTPTPVAEG